MQQLVRNNCIKQINADIMSIQHANEQVNVPEIVSKQVDSTYQPTCQCISVNQPID